MFRRALPSASGYFWSDDESRELETGSHGGTDISLTRPSSRHINRRREPRQDSPEVPEGSDLVRPKLGLDFIHTRHRSTNRR